MGYIIDGIYYEEYPAEEERISTLREDRDFWRGEAMRLAVEKASVE